MTGFLTAFLAVLASELGDRTFILTTILAMKHSKISVFMGAMTAAALMISISGLIGASSSIIPKDVVHFLSVALFFVFGIQMLVEARSMSPDGDEKDVLSEIPDTAGERIEDRNGFQSPSGRKDASSILSSDGKPKIRQSLFWSGVFVSTFTMNFCAEWGDKSQISVILLAAKDDLFLVLGGALFGHFLANAVAVLGGSLIRDIISIRTVTLIGGITFIGFALLSVIT